MSRAFTDPGIPWLGSVPTDWRIEPFRRHFRESSEVNGPAPVGPMLSISGYRGVEEKIYESASQVREDAQLENYRVVRPGQLAVNTMWLNYAGLGVSELLGHMSPAYRAYWISDKLDKRFTHHLLRSAIYVQGYTALLTGIRPNSLQMSRADLMAFPILVPPINEQRAIADFLDRETAQIDAFIAKNEELITLLTERRSAVTAAAVTRGIDPDVEMRESGVPWIGQIPAGWRAVRVKFVIESLPGYAFASSEFVDSSDAVPLLRGVNVNVGRIAWNEVVSIEDPMPEVARRYMLREGDLVLGMDRPVIKGGLRIASIDEEDAGALLVQRVLRIRGAGVSNAFLRYSLEWGGFAMYIEPDFTGVSVPHMSEQQVGNFAIALPDASTQRRIVDHIHQEHASIDAALDAARRSVELARERRAALISAAVTGKIDVGVGA